MKFPPLNEQMDSIKRGAIEVLPEEELVKKIERSIKKEKPLLLNKVLILPHRISILAIPLVFAN